MEKDEKRPVINFNDPPKKPKRNRIMLDVVIYEDGSTNRVNFPKKGQKENTPTKKE